jgi:hypothetical protein
LRNANLTFYFPDDADARNSRCDLLEQFEPLCAQTKFELCKSGNIAVRSRHTPNKTGADRIDALGHHDRYGVGCLLQSLCRRANTCHQHIGAKRDQLRRVPAQPFKVAAAPTDVEQQVAANSPTRFAKSLLERRDAGLEIRFFRGRGHKHADAPCTLLRACPQGPRHRSAAKNCDTP